MLVVAQRQLEHAMVEGVEASQGDKLEFLTHLPEFLLEDCNRFWIKLLTPVE